MARSGGRTNPSVNIDEPLISNARSKPRTPKRVEHRGERRHHEDQPHEGQHEQPDRCVQRHDPVAGLVGPGQPHQPVEHPAQADEHRPRRDRRLAPGQHERADRRIDHEHDQEHAAGEPQHLHHDVHGRSASQTLATRGQVEVGGGRACVPTAAAWRRAAECAPPSSAWWHAEAVRSAARRPAGPATGRGRSRGSAPASGVSEAVARTTGPSCSRRRARWRGPRERDSATLNRTSTRVSEVLACWPPGPPERLVCHSSSSSAITQLGVTRSFPSTP